MKEKLKDVLYFEIFGFVLSALYFIAVADLPYGYYQFLRAASMFFLPIYLLSCLHESENNGIDKFIFIIIVAIAVIAILFNPICPIYMDKDSWVVIDVICGSFFVLVNIAVLFLSNKKD